MKLTEPLANSPALSPISQSKGFTATQLLLFAAVVAAAWVRWAVSGPVGVRASEPPPPPPQAARLSVVSAKAMQRSGVVRAEVMVGSQWLAS